MQIQHNLHGGRTIVSQHGSTRIVTTGRQGGYVQKPYVTRGGHSYYQRTYYDHGHYRAGVYRGYSYGGSTYYGYTPTSYYSPAYYGWAGSPWPVAVSWDVGLWGWAGASWYSYYGFTPYPVYASPAFWLTDYLIAADLQAAYAAAAEAPVVVAPVVAAGLPMQIVEHEGNSSDSPVWTFNGTQGIGQFTTGNQPLTIERFDGATIAVRRQDIGGISALYAGQIVGNLVSGQVTYFRRDGSAAVGVWSGTIASWAPGAMVVAPAPVVAAVPTIPPVLNECEGPWCGTWTWDGAHYRAMWNQGSVAVLTVVRWDAQAIVITRVDPAGTTPGNMSTYTGTITGPNTASGGEQGVFQGSPWSLAWTITSPTALLLPAAPPVAVAAAPAPAAPEAAAPSGSDPIVLTPEVKQAIADEVRAQLKAESAAAQSGQGASDASSANELPPALDPNRRTFVVASDLTVTADGQECSLTQGDVLKRVTDTPDADGSVKVNVSSKRNDCAAGKLVSVSVEDLQEMRNHLAEQLDEGMKTLASKQGTGNMPKAPDTRTQAGAVPPPTADTGASQELQAQQVAADQTETQVKQETGQQ